MREADVAAAELALGVLDGEERAAALRRVLAEPDFARESSDGATISRCCSTGWPR